MLKLQVALIAILIACVAFVSCDRGPKMLEPVADDMMAVDDMMAADDLPMDTMMDMETDMTMYKSWAHVTLPEPVGTGTAHGTGARTVYFNDMGAMANKTGATYPAGTMIVKEIMDSTNTFIMTVARMVKSDDPMYSGHNGWMYVQVNRADATSDFMPQAGDIPGGSSAGCHGCHAKAGTEGVPGHDSVFVSLPMDTMMDDMPADDAPADDTPADDTPADDTPADDGMTGDINADVNGDGVVNILDQLTVENAIGQPVDADNMRADVNGDGVIDQSDVDAVKADFGETINDAQ